MRNETGTQQMYAVTVEAGFSAVHRVRLRDGTLEPQHGHDWHVRARFARAELDDAGMVIDFGNARSALQSIVAQLHHTNLNHHEDLADSNPTAEVVARYIFERLAKMGLSTVSRVEVTEAPGCVV
ncbi:MAG: 6-carboxytetrahydropterin synthase, partial [Phycisphaerae bacterium]